MESVIPENCIECGEDPKERGSGGMYKHNPRDKRLAKEYCERTANSNQIIKPVWRDCCGTLSHYSVKLKETDKPLWQQ